jgi:hypothetical protein
MGLFRNKSAAHAEAESAADVVEGGGLHSAIGFTGRRQS